MRVKKISLILAALPLSWTIGIEPAQVQPITPEADGTGTVVTPNGNRFDITGGQQSADRANLFHSFQQFGLNSNQIANFLSNPDIKNILGRVVGGDASVINGLIQVTGGNSNLYLMNPAGIIFGPNASLNVPASFTATTANGIGFGSNWFNAIGSNDYAALVGTPNSLAFTMQKPGAILNTGSLSVGQGNNLTLLGGIVVSTGQLSAPGGQLTIATVPGESLVRLNLPGMVLSLDVQPISSSSTQPKSWSLPILSLPQLLTGGGGGDATGVIVNSDGTIELSGSGIRVEPGDVVTTGSVTAQTATLSAEHNLTLVESQLQTSGDLNLLAQDTVRVRDSVASPFIATSGGNLYIQGNQSIDILALNHLSQTPFVSGGNLSLVSNGNVSGDAHFASGGSFSILNLSGKPGNFVSFYDPIISAVGDVSFGDYTGAALKVEATGSIRGGNITITGPDLLLAAFCAGNPCSADAKILAQSRAVILRAGLTELQETTFGYPGATFAADYFGGNAGSISLSAGGDIQTGTLSVIVTSTNGIGSNITLNASGSLTITTTARVFRATGTFTDQNGVTSSISTAGGAGSGSVTIQHDVGDASINGTAGAGATSSTNSNLPFRSFPGSYTRGNLQIITSPQFAQQLSDLIPQANPPKRLSNEVDNTPFPFEEYFTRQFDDYLGTSPPTRIKSLAEIQATLSTIEKATGVKPAIIYGLFVPKKIQLDDSQDSASRPLALTPSLSINRQLQPDDYLELVLISSQGKPIRIPLYNTKRDEVINTANNFRGDVQPESQTSNEQYKASAKKFYNWLITPLKSELKKRGIKNMVFAMDTDLRSIPLAALFNGQDYLIEEYSVGLIPSMSLTDTQYVDIKNTQVLAMGAQKFYPETKLRTLYAVPTETSIIKEFWSPGKPFLDKDFTLDNLKSQRHQRPFGIIHLATHGKFNSGSPSNSYIQLWGDERLRFNQIRQLGLNKPPVELLVLSVCETALGNEEAELGFAGFAVQAGVKSSLASLWEVSDVGTLGLMTQFYEQLKTAPIKAEALRQAQLAMLKGEVYIENGQLHVAGARGSVPLPPELANLDNKKLSHPYYWAAFTMIGNPW